MSSTKPLKARIVVGNIKCRKNYHPEDKAFHSSAIPSHARAARLEVKKSTKPDLLGLTKPKWNGDMSLDRPLCERNSAQLRKFSRNEYRFNYRAEKLPDPEPVEAVDPFGKTLKTHLRTTKTVEEMPTHPSLVDKARWETGTKMTEKEVEQQHQQEKKKHAKHSRMVGKALLDYKSPKEQEEAWLEALRERRERAASGDMSPQRPVRKTRGPGLKLTSTVTRRFKTYSHTGTFGKTPFEKDRVWSCCLGSITQENQKYFFESIFLQVLEDRAITPEVKEDAGSDSKKNFLSTFVHFCTGLHYLPSKEADPDFSIQLEFSSGLKEDYLPKAHTCTKELVVPKGAYNNDKELFEENLIMAIEYSQSSFGMR